MLDLWFFFYILATIGVFVVAIGWRNIPVFVLGAVLLLGAGLVLQTEGVQTVTAYTINSTATFVDSNYSVWSGGTCPTVLPSGVVHCYKDLSLTVFSNIFLYGGLVLLLVAFVLFIVWRNKK